MLEQVVLKELVTAKDLEQVHHLDERIWGSIAIPTHQTLAAVNNGGIVIGAYYEEEMVGFSYSFPGFKEGKNYLHSHMLGVAKAFRERGIGELLKHQQKELAQDRDYRLISWVFDPLESKNANLAFSKLGAISHSYIQDYYGEIRDDFNVGLPTDRLQVEWWLERNRVDDVIEELTDGAKEIAPWSLNTTGLPEIDNLNEFNPEMAYSNDAYLLAIPQDFQKIKMGNLSLAEDWRYKIRTILNTLFGQGYAIVRLQQKSEHVHMYVLVKRSLLAI